MSGFDLGRTWFGVGVKGGGILIAGGVESIYGKLFNLKNPGWHVTFSLMNIRFGLGIGGSGGIVALGVFNSRYIWEIDDTTSSDWGINLAFGNRWSAMAKALKNYKFFAAVGEIGAKLALRPGHLETIRNSMHYLYNAYDIRTGDNAPKTIALDTPVGLGVEASINWCAGRINIDR